VVVKTKNQEAVGAVCRSQDGSYLGASAVTFEGVTVPGCLEAMACREALPLPLAADLLVSKITVASDCMDVVKGLHGRHMGTYSHILIEIKETALHRGGRSFRHEERRSNTEAHLLAPVCVVTTAWPPCVARC
jgi:hypothetical protein